MMLFTPAQHAFLASGNYFQDGVFPWRMLDSGSLYSALDSRYLREVPDVPAPEAYDIATALPVLDARYLRTVGLSDLKQEVVDAFTPQPVPARTWRMGNYSTVVSGTTTTLPFTPLSWFDIQVFINGLLQDTGFYTLSGKVITFTAALSGDGVQVVYAYEGV